VRAQSDLCLGFPAMKYDWEHRSLQAVSPFPVSSFKAPILQHIGAQLYHCDSTAVSGAALGIRSASACLQGHGLKNIWDEIYSPVKNLNGAPHNRFFNLFVASSVKKFVIIVIK